jgi:hypothetical protein
MEKCSLFGIGIEEVAFRQHQLVRGPPFAKLCSMPSYADAVRTSFSREIEGGIKVYSGRLDAFFTVGAYVVPENNLFHPTDKCGRCRVPHGGDFWRTL